MEQDEGKEQEGEGGKRQPWRVAAAKGLMMASESSRRRGAVSFQSHQTHGPDVLYQRGRGAVSDVVAAADGRRRQVFCRAALSDMHSHAPWRLAVT